MSSLTRLRLLATTAAILLSTHLHAQSILAEAGYGAQRANLENSSKSDVCRDVRDGRFADDANCNSNHFEYAGMIRAGYEIQDSVRLSVGLRAGSQVTAFGEIRARVGTSGRFYVRGGPNYFGIGVAFDGN